MTWQQHLAENHPPALDWESCNEAISFNKFLEKIIEETGTEIEPSEFLLQLESIPYHKERIDRQVLYLL